MELVMRDLREGSIHEVVKSQANALDWSVG